MDAGRGEATAAGRRLRWLALPAALLAAAWLLRASPARSPRRNRPRMVVLAVGPVRVDGLDALLLHPSLPAIRRMRNGGSALRLWSQALAVEAGLLGPEGGDPKRRGLRGWIDALERRRWRVVRLRSDAGTAPPPLGPCLEEADAVFWDCSAAEGEEPLALLGRIDAWLAAGLPASSRDVAVALVLHGRFRSPADVGGALLWGGAFRPHLEDRIVRAESFVRALYYLAGIEAETPGRGETAFEIVTPRYYLHHEPRGEAR